MPQRQNALARLEHHQKQKAIVVAALVALLPALLLLNLILERIQIAQERGREIVLGLAVSAIAAKIRASPAEYGFLDSIIVWAIILGGLVAPLLFLPNERYVVFTYEMAYFFGLLIFATLLPCKWRNSQKGKE